MKELPFRHMWSLQGRNACFLTNGARPVDTLDKLPELMLLEEFKKRLPEKIVIYLNEQKVTSLKAAAVLADEFALTHKSVFSPHVRHDSVVADRKAKSPKGYHRNPTTTADAETRECFYCHEQGHLIAVCPTLKKKQHTRNVKTPSPIALIQTKPSSILDVNVTEGENDDIDEDFRPFISQGFVSLVDDATPVPVTILRDTAAKQSLILSNILPFSPQSYCGSDILAWGVKMSAVCAPLHFIHLSSKLASGKCKIAVRPQLPIAGVDLILRNDLAGGKVFSSPEVIESPVADLSVSDPVASDSVSLLPVCVVTRAQARKFGDLVDLSDF